MKLDEIIACLNHVPIFDDLLKEEKHKIALIARHKNFNKNELLYTSGDELNALYVVHEGSVKIIRYTIDGREQVIRILKHGDFFGETALFGNKKVNNYAEVLEDAVICKIERKEFSEIIRTTPSIASKMLLELSNRLEYIEEIITFNNLKTSEAKLAKYLLDNANNNNVYFNTTKKTISAHIGITPETFSRKLNDFNAKGYIKIISNKEITILDYKSLEEIVYI